ncbi:MAG: response regulator transcription factor [Sphingobacteriia bacterium]|nr:response regulator transcription factor [Sphingobacteriia bacterium]
MKTVIIEDERKCLTHLKGLLTNLPLITLVGEAMNYADGIKLVSTVKPELLLLDIQLQETNGFELLTSLGDYNFDVIFITAYDQYGIQAVKSSALDYILKPVKLLDLTLAIQKATKRREHRQTQEKIQNLLSIVNQEPKEHRIGIPLLKELRFIDPSTIIRCEAANNYTHIFLDNGEKLIVSKGLGEFDDMLKPYHFIRCHQSHLVNRKYIKSLLSRDNVFEIKLIENSPLIPVSRLKKDLVKAELLIQS